MIQVRPNVQAMAPYVPGEQPAAGTKVIKLNTNENPYPPSLRVRAAVRAATDDRLRLYPNPTAAKLRERLARWHRCAPENLLVGNGSDELLALATRAFVEPVGCGGNAGASERRATAQATIQFFTPSYSLYPVLAAIHGARAHPVALRPDFSLPPLVALRREKSWEFDAALSFITTPNAPSGRGYATAALKALCAAQRGVVVLDEAYVDFAEENALRLALEQPRVLVMRTFSKAYSLCFQRVGYCLGPVPLIAALEKVKDSYNVNGLGQVAALATLDDLEYYRANFRRVRATRAWLSLELDRLGFEVFPSQTNFLLVRPPRFSAREWLEALRARKLLVRWFSAPEVSAYLRITVGTDAEARALVRAARAVLGSAKG